MKLKNILPFLLLFTSTIVSGQDWNSLNQKALDLYQKGKYSQAIKFADEALNAAKSEFGVNSEEYLSSLTNKAYAQYYSGEYQPALKNFLLLANISTRLYQLPHVAQMQAMIEVSKAYMNLAQYDSAEYYLDIGKNIYFNIPKTNKEHYDSAIVEIFDSSLKLSATEASLMHKKGQLTRAITVLLELSYSVQQVYPDTYTEMADYRTIVNNLTTYYNEGLFLSQAKKYALEYYDLVQDESDPFNRIYAFQNLGSIYRNLESYDSAEYYWRQGLKLVNRSNYKETYIHTVLLNNLGELYAELETYDSAIKVLLKSLSIQMSNESVSPPLFRTTRFNLAECYHWNGEYATADSIYEDLVEEWITEIIDNFSYLSDNEKMSFYKNQQYFLDHYRSFALEITGILPIQESEEPYIDSQVPGKLYDLQLTTKAIILNASKKMRTRILNSGNSELANNYRIWEEQKYLLANALISAERSEKELQIMQKSLDDMERYLIRNSNSFKSGFKFERVNWKQIQQKLGPGEAAVEMVRLIDGLIYGALILTPETTDQPILTLVMSTRSKHLERQFYQNYYNSIVYKIEDSLSYKTYWQPIMDTLINAMHDKKIPNKIYFSNDGIYNRINPNTLKNPSSGNYVIDETEVILLTNTREILEPKKKIQPAEKWATLVGRPKFSLSDSDTTAGSGRSARGEVFQDLPGTGKEVEAIDQLLKQSEWKTQVLTGADASEHELRKIEQAHVLHIASHGYFDPKVEDEQNSLAEIMIGSGIALAGVNDPVTENGDGLLSAFEMIAMDLDSTELVILSACETGKGASNGEGVYGLQRALKVAGAQHMIMSLWKVDDTATQELMTEFYKQWTLNNDLRKGFLEAQKKLRERYPDPYYWGAFVLAGD